MWYKYYIKNFLWLVYTHLGIKAKEFKYKNGIKLKKNETQDIISEYIKYGKPVMIARYGCFEGKVTAEGIGIKLKVKKNFNDKILNHIHINAGLFPYGNETALKFANIMEKASKEVDILGVWNTYMQDYLVDNICNKQIKITNINNLEPYYDYETIPWTYSLKGKKVVVVHPFNQTIETQYKKRKKLFKNPYILPKFYLRTVKAVQTIAGSKDERFNNWFDALDFMYDEVMKEDFDVAIIGCGAYGFPLAAKIKENGKIAIHLGGATQILFGIKGERWDKSPIVSKLYNKYWVRPSLKDRPKDLEKVERGCYW